MQDSMNRLFKDSLAFNGQTKTAISVRDGVQEYYGYELGLEPIDRVFTVYRSPATIANAATAMFGIPLTDEHVDLNAPPTNAVGTVLKALMIDLKDESLGCTLAVENQIQVDESMMGALQSGKRELSLGYRAELVAHNQYDYEQRNIEPHHLAVVDRGRCGAHCSFIDQKGELMKSPPAFRDADGNPNLEEIVQIAASLPEAIKKLDMEQLAKVMPMLAEIVQVARADGQTAEVRAQMGTEATADGNYEDMPAEEKPTEDMEAVKDGDAMKDGETEDMEKEKVGVTDCAGVKPTEWRDSAAFKDAVMQALTEHTLTIEKARDFVDAGYVFVGKTTCQIKRDALTSQYGKQTFSDAELPVAFKLLKKSESNLTNFGDAKDPFELLKHKEL